MTEQEWQRMERTMQYMPELHAKADERFHWAERRLEELERLGKLMMKAGDRRFRHAETRLDRVEEGLDRLHVEMRDLRRNVNDLVISLRVSTRGNGRGRGNRN